MPKTVIDYRQLAVILNDRSPFLLNQQLKRGYKVVRNLEFGAPSLQKTSLPGVFCDNAKISFVYGREMTDTLAAWVSAGFVCGPFTQPPLEKFRVNSLLMVPQTDKVRPVLNVSLPKDRSFNDNIDNFQLEKVTMTSARQFSYSILLAGKDSVMSKYDQKDAYKNVPAPISDLRLQGFSWLGKFFIETQQIFGARTAVSNFDVLGKSILDIVLTMCDIPKILVHRQLDDVPVVAPAGSKLCEEFSEQYKMICGKIGVKLAADFPHNEKSFSNSTHGKVLGIDFDTTNLTWKLPVDKSDRAFSDIFIFLNSEFVTLDQCRSLTGRLLDIGLMCPFICLFKRNILDLLHSAEESDSNAVFVTSAAKDDLYVWWAVISAAVKGLPIASEMSAPTLRHKTFTSDAAGMSSNSRKIGKVGAGCIGLDEMGRLCLATQIWWNSQTLDTCLDEKGCRYGDKMTTLEFAGLMVPFLVMPNQLRNQHVVIQVDNISCCYGWGNGSVKGDLSASILIRALGLIAAKLSTIIHIVHLPRNSVWESKFADRLTRSETTSCQDSCTVRSFGNLQVPAVFRDWIDNPSQDWSFCTKLLEVIK